MKIGFARTIRIEKWVTITVTHNRKKFDISVFTKDGKVQGDDTGQSGLYTSYLTYFNEVPLKVRKKHFNQIKMHVEKYIR